MGCFFACFRVNNCERQDTHLVSKSISSKSRDLLVTRNQLASVFLCEGKVPNFSEKGSPSEQGRHLSLQQNFDRESADEALKDEVNFLKSCGTLLETPIEIRKASEKSTVEIPTTDIACKKLHWDEQHDDLSDAATKGNEDSGSPESKAGSFSLEERQTQRKSVRFDEEVEHISRNKLLDSADQNISPQTGNQTQQLGSDHSPYPTPQSLSEDVQTPRTIYTPKSTGNNARIQTQYVYPISNSLQNLSSTEGAQMRNFIQDGEKSQQTSVTLCSTELSPDDKGFSDHHTAFKEKIDFNQETPKLVVSSLSQWLKPPLTKEERWEKSNVMNERSPSSKSPNAERPIIGMVAAHWKENEPSSISPKWFDGNGIPNSTNKYKEDQKVSWHATPFEERLEKALSDEKFFPRRELNGRPVNLDDEGEESDTAAS